MNQKNINSFKSWIGLILLIIFVAAGAKYTVGCWASVISAVFFRGLGIAAGMYSVYYKYKELDLR